MTRTRTRRSSGFPIVVGFLLALLVSPEARPQQPREYEVKATFSSQLLKLARFVGPGEGN